LKQATFYLPFHSKISIVPFSQYPFRTLLLSRPPKLAPPKLHPPHQLNGKEEHPNLATSQNKPSEKVDYVILNFHRIRSDVIIDSQAFNLVKFSIRFSHLMEEEVGIFIPFNHNTLDF
jgi:hypothetical protein